MTWKDDNKKIKEAYPPSNKSYDEKCRLINAMRARIISNDKGLSGLLTFVEHTVVKEGEFMFEEVAYTDGNKMFFCDKFFSQPIPIMCAIIMHEMFHIVFRHVSRGRTRIGHLYNVAADAIINDSIGYKQDMGSHNVQGDNAIYLDKEHCVSLDALYEKTKLPPEERKALHEWTAESLYEILIRQLKKNLEEKKKNQKGKGKDKNKGKGNEKGEGQGNGQGEGEGEGQGQGNGSGNQNSNNSPGQRGPSSSSPSSSPSNSGNSPLGELEKEIEDLMNELAEEFPMFGGDDMKDISPDKNDPANQQINDAIWTERFNRAKAEGAGKNSILGRVNPDVYKAQVPWEKELKKFLVKACMPETEQTWVRPSRRLSSVARQSRTYLPGSTRRKGLDKMLVIIDTSGSCFNTEELTMFCTEIDEIQNKTGVELYLIFADTDVEAEYHVKPHGGGLLEKMKKGEIKAAGGGGTDMVKPFMYGKEKYKPMVTVIATDGYTPFPNRKQTKGTNTIWVINTEAVAPKEAGKTVHIKKK